MNPYGYGHVPGAGQGAPISERPAGTPGIGGMIRAARKSVVLARVNTSGAARTSAAVSARVVNPAARLICSFSITFSRTAPRRSRTTIPPFGPRR